ncbi:MAG: DUF3079 domain-containing protein [Chrysiogenetes bacterium]|nr:DUF3079 domain-containing protein [Chrysiogenetes bacterium]
MVLVRHPHQPRHPERVCWGCDRYCPATDMACSKERTLHPVELFGAGWRKNDDGESGDRDDAREGLAQRPRVHDSSGWESAAKSRLGPVSRSGRTAAMLVVPGCASPSIEVPVSIGESVSGRGCRGGARARVRPDAGEKLNERCRSR